MPTKPFIFLWASNLTSKPLKPIKRILTRVSCLSVKSISMLYNNPI